MISRAVDSSQENGGYQPLTERALEIAPLRQHESRFYSQR